MRISESRIRRIIREKYYPGLTAEDCAMIAAELDRYFGMD